MKLSKLRASCATRKVGGEVVHKHGHHSISKLVRKLHRAIGGMVGGSDAPKNLGRPGRKAGGGVPTIAKAEGGGVHHHEHHDKHHHKDKHDHKHGHKHEHDHKHGHKHHHGHDHDHGHKHGEKHHHEHHHLHLKKGGRLKLRRAFGGKAIKQSKSPGADENEGSIEEQSKGDMTRVKRGMPKVDGEMRHAGGRTSMGRATPTMPQDKEQHHYEAPEDDAAFENHKGSHDYHRMKAVGGQVQTKYGAPFDDGHLNDDGHKAKGYDKEYKHTGGRTRERKDGDDGDKEDERVGRKAGGPTFREDEQTSGDGKPASDRKKEAVRGGQNAMPTDGIRENFRDTTLEAPGRKHGGETHDDEKEDKEVVRDMVKGSALKHGKADGGGSHWIKGAIKHPGGLHRALHVPEGDKIPAKKLAAAKHSKNEHVRRMAAFAHTLKGFHKG